MTQCSLADFHPSGEDATSRLTEAGDDPELTHATQGLRQYPAVDPCPPPDVRLCHLRAGGSGTRASAVGSHRYKQLSRVDVAPLLHVGVLGCDMEIAEPPLQHRILINGRAAAEREAHLGDAQACIGDPYGGLSTFSHEGFVPQSAGTRVAPMAGCLDLKI